MKNLEEKTKEAVAALSKKLEYSKTTGLNVMIHGENKANSQELLKKICAEFPEEQIYLVPDNSLDIPKPSPKTQFIVFNNLPLNFDTRNLFHFYHRGILVNKKDSEPFIIYPKFILVYNDKIIEELDGSTKRRVEIFES